LLTLELLLQVSDTAQCFLQLVLLGLVLPSDFLFATLLANRQHLDALLHLGYVLLRLLQVEVFVVELIFKCFDPLFILFKVSFLPINDLFQTEVLFNFQLQLLL